MQINFTVFATGVILAGNKLRYIAYEASTPTAEVARITEDPPHTFPHAVTVNVPNPVVHILKIYSTPDASTGTLISEFIYDPTYTNVQVRLPLQLVAGGPGEFDPVADSNQIVIPDLVDWAGLWYPERRANAGTMADYEYTILPGGGLQLVGDDTIADGELFWIHFEPKITLSTPIFAYLNLFSSLLVLDHSVTLDSTAYRTAIAIAATGAAITITLPPLASVPNQTLFVFNTFNGNQKQASITTQSGEPIKIFNGNSSFIYLGSGEFAWLLKEADGYYPLQISDGIFRVGAQVDSDVLLPNTAWLDGGSMPASDYPRVLAYINALPAGQLLTKATRDAGGLATAAQWAYEASTDLIWRPDYRGLTKRAIPGTRGNDSQRTNSSIPGSYGADFVNDHKHFTVVPGQYNTGGFPNNIGRGMSSTQSIFEAWSKTTGNGKESAWISAAASSSDIPNTGPTAGLITGGGAIENLVKTVGVKTLVYI
jgi:hypothetical protein